jgi:hypothetical protein
MPVLNNAATVSVQLEKVEPQVQQLFERDDTFYSGIEKRKGTAISSRDMRIPLKLAPGGYFGYFNPEGGDLGRGGSQSYDHAVINTVANRYAIEWNKRPEWATDSARKSVLDVVKDLVADAMPEFRRNLDSLCMTSGNGVLGTITSVSNSGGFDTYTLNTDGYGIRLVRKGMKINVYDTTLATNRTSGGEVEIDRYDLENKQIRVAQVTGAVATDLIVSSGLSGASPTGLLGVPHHNTNSTVGTWLGFTRANTPEIRASRVNGGGNAFTLPFARLAVTKVGDRVGKLHGKKFVAWTHPAQEAAYEELGFMVTNIDKTSSNNDLNLYFGGAKQLAGAKLMTSYNWDKKRIDFMDMDTWGRVEMYPPGFYKSRSGQQFFQIYSTTTGGVVASEVFYLVAVWNMYNGNPASAVYIDNLAIPSGY